MNEHASCSACHPEQKMHNYLFPYVKGSIVIRLTVFDAEASKYVEVLMLNKTFFIYMLCICWYG